jgi:hypothetical protein
MRIILASSLLLLAACGARGDSVDEKHAAALPAAPVKPAPLSDMERGAKSTLDKAKSAAGQEALIGKVKKALNLYDPFSAKFQRVRSGKQGAICGQYNAKNLNGAYVGFKDFVVFKDGGAVTSLYNNGVRSDVSSSFAYAYVDHCASTAEKRAFEAATMPVYDYGYGGNMTGGNMSSMSNSMY